MNRRGASDVLRIGAIGEGAATMERKMLRICAMVLLIGLAACSGQPWTLSRSPEAIAVRWYPDQTDILAANQVAELHCRSWGKTAQLAFDTRDGSAEIARYRCR
jgi:hypothetical protein